MVSRSLSAFRRLVADLDEILNKRQPAPPAMLSSLEQEMDRVLELMNELISRTSAVSAAEQQALGEAVKHELLPFLLLSRSTERVYHKPRGYNGDYATIDVIYRNEPAGVGEIGAVLDRLFLELPACRAVRNRRALVAAEIERTIAERGTNARVTSLACGPSREIMDVFARTSEGCIATLVDFDLQALAFVDEWRVRMKLGRKVQLVNLNLVAVATNRESLARAPQDLIYSIGLVDYFSDQLVVMLLNQIHASLAPGGRVILGNFHTRNPMKSFMDHVLDWKLIHRSESDMDALFAQSAFQRPSTRVCFEESGINLFAECVKS